MDVLAFLDERGALRRGLTHFRNGLVSNGWIEKGAIFHDPQALNRLAQEQARALAQAFPDATLLVGAPACGATLASFVGLHLNLPVAYVLLGPEPAWHRMHVPRPGQRAVYVDDLICTGTDARAALAFLRHAGHHALGISAWISRAQWPGERLVTLAPAPFWTHAPGPGEPGNSPPLSPLYTGVRE